LYTISTLSEAIVVHDALSNFLELNRSAVSIISILNNVLMITIPLNIDRLANFHTYKGTRPPNI